MRNLLLSFSDLYCTAERKKESFTDEMMNIMSKIKAETSKGMHESNKGKNGSSGKSFYLRLRFEKIMIEIFHP